MILTPGEAVTATVSCPKVDYDSNGYSRKCWHDNTTNLQVCVGWCWCWSWYVDTEELLSRGTRLGDAIVGSNGSMDVTRC